MGRTRSSRAASRAAAVLAVAAAALLAVTTAGPAAASTDPAPAAVSRTSAAEEAAQRRLAADGGRARLEELALQAGRALEAHQRALTAQDSALARHAEQTRQLRAADADAADADAELGRWAAHAYRDGVLPSEHLQLLTALDATSPDEVTARVALLGSVGRERSTAVERAASTRSAHRDRVADAAAAVEAALAATREAEAARTEADRLVAEQRALVAALDVEAERAEGAAAAAAAQSGRLGAARAAAWQARLATSPGAALALTGTTGTCRSSDVSGYPNGAIPAEALCPLWTAPGHLLRADAAAAFDALATDFAAAFGRPLCVTDSYRSLAAQVDVHARKPHLAAKPGTSNHGRGVALDLCGGVQRFGSDEHAWMRTHAPLHGWFHPQWAQAGGSKPEAWHWEFAG